MKYVAVATTILVAACSGPMPDIRPYLTTQGAAASPFDNVYQAGKAQLMANRLGLAIVMFEKALTIDPRSVATLNAIGAAYDELHRPEVAKLYYAQALAIEPNSADTINNMAVSAAMAGDKATARTLFARAAGLAPSNSIIDGNLKIAATAPLADNPPTADDEDDDDRPRLERTGVAEVTLTIPQIFVEKPKISAPMPPRRQRKVVTAPTLPAKPADWRDFGRELWEAKNGSA